MAAHVPRPAAPDGERTLGPRVLTVAPEHEDGAMDLSPGGAVRGVERAIQVKRRAVVGAYALDRRRGEGASVDRRVLRGNRPRRAAPLLEHVTHVELGAGPEQALG